MHLHAETTNNYRWRWGVLMLRRKFLPICSVIVTAYISPYKSIEHWEVSLKQNIGQADMIHISEVVIRYEVQRLLCFIVLINWHVPKGLHSSWQVRWPRIWDWSHLFGSWFTAIIIDISFVVGDTVSTHTLVKLEPLVQCTLFCVVQKGSLHLLLLTPC